jgi:PiT family inorganic phosphate transporter
VDLTVLLFLTSGLFLGWSLGANDAANVFGTAVGTRMVQFATAAVVCSIFVILGAVISGAGATQTLGTLGAVNALAGAFMVALAAALTVYAMTNWGLTVSTSQAIVGAIIGWNLFSGSVTDTATLAKIFATWVASPVLAGIFAAIILKLAQVFQRVVKLHLLRLDAYSRLFLICGGAFGAYSLGANNIANVMGVFVPVTPFTDFNMGSLFKLTGVQQLFLLGAVAISVGVFTYSKRVMLTVGRELLPLSPVAAWVAVVAHSIVLFLFTSEGLEHLLARAGLPTIPLVPVSLCFVALFFLQNVFNQQVYREIHYQLSGPGLAQLSEREVPTRELQELEDQEFATGAEFLRAVRARVSLTRQQEARIIAYAELGDYSITPKKLESLDKEWLTPAQIMALRRLVGKEFNHKWQLAEALAQESKEWQPLKNTTLNKLYNNELNRKLSYVYDTFATKE